MKVSIKSVASSARVAPSTVSKVLNDTPGFSVPPDTRQRILQAASELGYVPNRMAQTLGRGKSNIIGLVVDGLRNPIYADLVEVVSELAPEHGYHAMIEITPGNSSQTVRRGNLSGWPVDGMLVWTNPWQVLQTQEQQAFAGPIVYLGHTRQDETSWLAFDLYGGGRMIAEHIYDRGYHNVWYVTPFRSHVSTLIEDRVRAFVEVSAERGLPGRVVAAPTEAVTRQNGMDMAAVIAALPRAERPDAVICHNDLIAIGMFYGLRRSGLRVPTDIAVTGFDGLLEGQCLDKKLTTVSISAGLMARRAVDILVGQISGTTPGLAQEIVPVQLIAGETS